MGRLPKVISQNGLSMHSLFSRLNATGHKRDNTRSEYGDNSPYIYALKGLDGLSVCPETAEEMLVVEKRLVGIFKKHCPEFDMIIPAPSGYSIATDLAQRVSCAYNNTPIAENYLQKASIASVLRQLDEITTDVVPNAAIQHIRKQTKIQLKEGGGDSDQSFSIKRVFTKYRKYISPITLNESLELKTPDPQRTLLIDDQLSSGTTLLSAQEAMLSLYPDVKIEALALFGALFGKLSK